MYNSMIRQDLAEGKICQHADAGWLAEVFPVSHVEDLLDTYQLWEDRERKLNMVAIVYWLLCLHLYPQLSQRAVYQQMLSALLVVRTRKEFELETPVKSAFCYRRAQLGSEIMEELFRQVARPQATEETPGAFWKGMRLLALDGTQESVPDTVANREAFQCWAEDTTTQSPYPQARVLLVVECGTHLICDAQITTSREGEPTVARRLLERFDWHGSLLLWDSAFYANQAIFTVREAGGHLLGPIRSTVLTKPWVTLCDGSELVSIHPKPKQKRGEVQFLRIITYTFTDPRFPQAGKRVYRLVTTLLDPFAYPALDLVVLYHQRWQIEMTIDETRCDLRLSEQTLRSRTPDGVIQELYALFVVHILIRTLMLRAANAVQLAPLALSFTDTLRSLEVSQSAFALGTPARRAEQMEDLLATIGTHRLPKQPLRLLRRELKRSHLPFPHKQPRTWQSLPFQPDFDIRTVIALGGLIDS